MTTRPSNPCHPESDREALSALFDGELVGDVARFALKRLDHDQDWRSTCERWQVVGDVLRNRHAPLPVTFQSRLRDAVHAQARHAGAQPAAAAPPAVRRGALRWGGAALAASAAVVAVFLAGSPFGGGAPEGPQVADAPLPSASKPQFASEAPLAPAIDLDTATAAVAVAAAGSQRSRSLQRDRAATDRIVSAALAAQAPITADAGPLPAARVIDEDLAGAAPASTDAGAATSPFTGATPEARPWPRAVLPQYRDRGGALAADFASAPSFYPFVPSANAPASEDAPASPATDPAASPPPAPPTAQSPPPPAP